MRTKTYLTSITLAACMLLTAGFQAMAQAPGGGQGRGGFTTLTEDQRTKMREAGTALREEMAKYTEKLEAAQREALKVALEKTVDEKALKEKVEAVQKIQTEMALARLKAMKGVKDTLTDEQKKQMLERPGMAYNMFLGGGGFGMPMGGGRRGGGGGGN